MSLHDAYGLTCLVLGGALVLTQIISALRPSGAAAATESARRAADLARSAARTTRAAAQEALTSFPDTPLGQESLFTDLRDRMRGAGREAEEAERSADEAATEAAKGAGKYDVLSALAGKAPLAVTGALLIGLGAVIMGFIELSASATAG